MAQKIIYADDIDGTEGAEPVTFAFKGQAYELDLSAKNLEKLEKALQPYVAAARPVGTFRDVTPVPKSGTRRRSSGTRTPEDYPREAVRVWARGEGIEVGDRGRIKADVVAKWKEAGSPGA